MIYGQDWSSYQSATPSTTGLSFAFVKATEGLGYVNPKAPAQIAHARAAGLTVGWYHYPHIANSASAEADYFLAHAAIHPGDLIALDWEWYGQTVTADQARAYKAAWLSRARLKMTGHRVGLYVDRSNWTTVDRDSDCGDFLWIADVTTAGKPRVQHAWTFHQYSTAGGVDHDAGNFPTAAALKAWATGKTTTPATPPKGDDVLTAADVKTALTTDGILNAPKDAADYKTNPKWTQQSHIEATTTASRAAATNTTAILAQLKTVAAQQGAMAAAITALAKDGGLTAEQITAAAQAGAQAALAELGHDLTNQTPTT